MGYLSRSRVFLSGLVIVFGLLGLAHVAASTSSSNISRSYKASGSIPSGSLVSLSKDKLDYVELANTKNGALLLGVAVESKESLLAVNSSDTTVQVATSGTANVLVSDLSGPIDVGDQITVSPFGGIGMVQTSSGNVIGLAQNKFETSGVGVSTQEVTDKAGQTKSISVGFVKVSIGVGASTSAGKGSEPEQNSLQKIAKSLVGHKVSTWRIVLSIIIVTVTFAALITLTYAAIYGSIISVGRNPLGSKAIFKTLRSVLGMAALTAVVAGVAIFFLLK